MGLDQLPALLPDGHALAQLSVSSGLVVAFIAVVPALVALAEWPYGVRPSRAQAAGITLGLVGVLMLAQGQGFSGSLSGLLALAVACTTWSVGSVVLLLMGRRQT